MKRKDTCRNLKGFTLLELLVVITISAVLSAIILSAINPVERLRQARDSGRRHDIAQIVTAIESYFIAGKKEQYPLGQGNADTALSYLTLDFLKRIPTNNPNYTYSSDGTIAYLFASLESETLGSDKYYCWNSSMASFYTILSTVSCP